jgi:SAM-dependent methyltransferase
MTKILYTNELRAKHEFAYANIPHWGNNYPYMFRAQDGKEVSHTDIINKLKPTSILDYGCGNGLILKDVTDMPAYGYDPFVSKYSTYPTVPCDLVLTNNAINHVENQYFDTVLDDLHFLTKKDLVAKIVILPNHQLRTKDWYIDQFNRHFEIYSSFLTDPVPILGMEKKWLDLSFLSLWCKPR